MPSRRKNKSRKRRKSRKSRKRRKSRKSRKRRKSRKSRKRRKSRKSRKRRKSRKSRKKQKNKGNKANGVYLKGGGNKLKGWLSMSSNLIYVSPKGQGRKYWTLKNIPKGLRPKIKFNDAKQQVNVNKYKFVYDKKADYNRHKKLF